MVATEQKFEITETFAVDDSGLLKPSLGSLGRHWHLTALDTTTSLREINHLSRYFFLGIYPELC